MWSQVGCLVGCQVDYQVGCRVDYLVGCRVDYRVDYQVGCRVGCRVGYRVGYRVGCQVGCHPSEKQLLSVRSVHFLHPCRSTFCHPSSLPLHLCVLLLCIPAALPHHYAPPCYNTWLYRKALQVPPGAWSGSVIALFGAAGRMVRLRHCAVWCRRAHGQAPSLRCLVPPGAWFSCHRRAVRRLPAQQSKQNHLPLAPGSAPGTRLCPRHQALPQAPGSAQAPTGD